MTAKLVTIFKALGDQTRLEIVSYLLHNKQCACDFCDCIPKDQTTISRHLKILEQSGIITSTKQGRNIIYRIKDDIKEQLRSFGITPKQSCCSGICSCEVKT